LGVRVPPFALLRSRRLLFYPDPQSFEVSGMRHLRLLLVLAAVTACNNDPGVDLTLPKTDADVAGAFRLTFANGLTPPFNTTVTTTELWTLTSDVMFVSANNTWADTTTYQVTSLSDGTQTNRQTASAGTYDIANNQINFVMTTGGSVTFEGAVTQGSL